MHPGGEGHAPIEVNGARVRQGETGHHLRYILAFGVGIVVLAFLLVALLV
jgi:hypothetical protein